MSLWGIGNTVFDSISKDANYHSARIEYPLVVEFQDYLEKKGPIKKSRVRKVRKNLEVAFSSGLKKYNGSLDEEFIKYLAGKIEPKLKNEDKSVKYRTMGVRTSGSSVTPPDSQKVRLEMEKYVKNVNELLKLLNHIPLSPIGVAAYAHLHLARIHPFEDGNGRTARMLQNLILFKNEYPLPIIEEGERLFYSGLIEEAIKGWKFGINRSVEIQDDLFNISDPERTFYDFIGSKVNMSLTKIIEKSILNE